MKKKHLNGCNGDICLDLNEAGVWLGGLAKVRLGQGPPSPPEKDGSDDDYQESDEEEEDGDDGHGGHGGERKKRKSEKTPMGGPPPGPTAAPELRDNAPVEGY